MADVWTPLLANLPLSKSEREVARRFSAEPLGRSFLPVADVLRAHRLVDESLELLTQGVERHPGFTVARVVLARELLAKGMIDTSWTLLEQAADSLRENVLAQKLRFKLALLLGHETDARASYQHLKLMQMLDPEVKRLGEMLEVSGLGEARQKLHQDLMARGTEIALPALPKAALKLPLPQDLPGSQEARTQPNSLPQTPTPELSYEASIAAFHVVPLSEIFRPEGDQGPSSKHGAGGLELDSTTLADIYARQGHYGKALEVYRRLLRVMPGSDLLRRKVAELSKLERDQRDVDLSVDPTLVDRMESVEIIDRQIKFYNDLLARLS